MSLARSASAASAESAAAEQINYAVDGTLSTYNTNTVTGAASAGPQAFARVLTGFTFHGPDGQALADHDFGSVAVVGREPLVLDYQIADNAVYSDGKPVTCDDMVLAWAAQSVPSSVAAKTRKQGLTSRSTKARDLSWIRFRSAKAPMSGQAPGPTTVTSASASSK